MAQICYVLALTLVAVATAHLQQKVATVTAAAGDTPIQQVITLLQNIKTESEDAARAEATVYTTFASDCKTQTESKTTDIVTATGNIDQFAADLGVSAGNRDSDAALLAARKTKKETLAAELKTIADACLARKNAFNLEKADLDAAILSLGEAIISAQNAGLLQVGAKGNKGAVFLQGSIDHNQLKKTLIFADMMGMLKLPKHRAVVSILQGAAGKATAVGDTLSNGEKMANALANTDQEAESRDYSFHSDDLVECLGALKTQFEGKRTAAQDIEGDATKGAVMACDLQKTANSNLDIANDGQITILEANVGKYEGEVGTHRGNIVTEQATLQDLKLYLNDLTSECEARATDWDQRTKMYADEVAALTSALALLQGDGSADGTSVSENIHVNVRALVQVQKVAKKAKHVAVGAHASQKKEVPKKLVALLQTVHEHKQKGFLAAGMTNAQKQDKALEMLAAEGQRLKSPVLMSLSQRATALSKRSSADPFVNVKGLVETLIKRLTQEAGAETTKKGFCDSEVAKAEAARSFRWQDTVAQSAAIGKLNAKKDELTSAISEATSSLEDISSVELEDGKSVTTGELPEAIEDRANDKAANEQTLSEAKLGQKALKEAITILMAFYKKGAKAFSFIQASPLVEAGVTAGFSGNYGGQQSGSKAILGLLATISSDFDRTIRMTEAAEKAAHRAFIKATDNLREQMAKLQQTIKLSNLDLTATNNKLATTTNELASAQDLLDTALKEIETLKPMCIDSGMSYSARVQKRVDEMTALKNALCMLGDPDTDNALGCAAINAAAASR